MATDESKCMTGDNSVCFLCGFRGSIIRLPKVPKSYNLNTLESKEVFVDWRTSIILSLCTTLDLEYENFENVFTCAEFCLKCQELLYHVDFTINAISRLHFTLASIQEELKSLVRKHYKKILAENPDNHETSEFQPIQKIIRIIGLKTENEPMEELQTAQYCELPNFPTSSSSLSQRLQDLKRRHAQAQALKFKSNVRNSLHKKDKSRSGHRNVSKGVIQSEEDIDLDMVGSTITQLNRITGSVRGSNFQCKICHSSFQDNWKLQRHFNTSTHKENADQNKRSVEQPERIGNSQDVVGSDPIRTNFCEDEFPGGSEEAGLAIDENCEDAREDNFVPRASRRRLLKNRSGCKRKHECKVCHAQFRDRWKLRRHTQSNVHSKSDAVIINYQNPRNVPCSYCTKKFQTEEILTNHIRLKHREQCHNCVFCPVKHSDRQAYVEHLNNCHTDQKIHLCQVCGKTFFFLHDLRYHSRYHQDDNKIPTQCKICNLQLPSETLLKSHQLSKHPDGGLLSLYTCPVSDCALRFPTAAGVQAHVRYLHAKRNNFECSFPGCSKRFGLQTKLDIHFVTHSEGTHLCQIDGCGKKYRHKKDLKSHMERCHSEDKSREKYSCPVCNKMYYRKDILRRHIVKKNHYGTTTSRPIELPAEPPPEAVQIGNFECHICCAALVDEVALKRHYFTHEHNELRPYACSQCQKRFATEEKVRAHMKRLHNGGIGCQFCGKQFAKSSRLRMHMLAHSNIRDHACETCGKGYKHQRDLRLHVNREHSGISAYRFHCSDCDKKFHRSDLLRYHQVKNHGITAPAEIIQIDNPEIRKLLQPTEKMNELIDN